MNQTENKSQISRAEAKRFLSYDYEISPRQYLLDLAEQTVPDERFDRFGNGAIYEWFDAKVAEVLGKDAALFFPTGRLAQLAVLRAWQEHGRAPTVVLHPRCHLQEHEHMSYQRAVGAIGVPAGDMMQPTTLSDIQGLTETPGLICLETPMLALGCRLISLADLAGIRAWADRYEVPVHLDGARLWEAATAYGCTPADLAAHADSVYVSFYKGLCAAAGAAVAGPEWLIRRLKSLREELGGVPPRNYVMVSDALSALKRNLPRIPAYRNKALTLAAALNEVDGVLVNPNPPHIDTFRVILQGTDAALREACVQVAKETGIWTVDVTPSLGLDGFCQFQVVVGDATLDISDEEAVSAVELLKITTLDISASS